MGPIMKCLRYSIQWKIKFNRNPLISKRSWNVKGELNPKIKCVLQYSIVMEENG